MIVQDDSKTDCRNVTGITVGLIDSLLTTGRVLAPRLKELEQQGSTAAWFQSGAVREALMDLYSDEDIYFITHVLFRWAKQIKAVYPEWEWPGQCQKFVRTSAVSRYPSQVCGVVHHPCEPCPPKEAK